MPKSAPKTIEILAPAGDEEMMRAAVFSGADCVYLGLQGFNARRSAGNFDEEALAEAVAFCHARGCGVYAALNTLVFPGREGAFAKALQAAQRAGCDAVIVQDLAAAALAKSAAPGLPLHASTQMSVHSLAGVQQLAAWGFQRAILARELHREEIAAIAAKSPIELEVFVHGALCFSVSGQCYFSAFLGGRSGNRGGCAGPCRLPFCTASPNAGAAKADEASHALSLKDLSILRELPQLAAMGVAAAKIEGRLRGPEYCAATVDAAYRARRGEAYDEGFLRDIFSRGPFTGGWYTGGSGREMFGSRGVGDDEKSRKALPLARDLYRRERPRVPVWMKLQLRQDEIWLQVGDGKNELVKTLAGPLVKAKENPTSNLQKALQKTGGTPFYLAEEPQLETGGYFAPAGAVGALRRSALEELLALRSQRPPAFLPRPQKPPLGSQPAEPASETPAFKRAVPPVKRQVQGLRARFASIKNFVPGAAALCEELLFPLGEAAQIPAELRGKTRLYLPRFLPGETENFVQKQLETAVSMDFLGFEAEGLAQLWLCRGLDLWGGFGLNLANAAAAGFLAEEGLLGATLSVELSLAQMRDLAAASPNNLLLDAIVYGHLPLMLTRACPVQEEGADCKICRGEAVLSDRKGQRFRLGCEGGMRSLYNPVALWMGDRLDELCADRATLYFTDETPEEALAILQAFTRGGKALGPFTRGLYDRGTEA